MTPIPLLNPDEVEADAWRCAVAGVPLVVRIARRHLGRGLDLEELVQEGLIGVFRAALDYDPRRGRREACYGERARYAMVGALVEKGSLVRMPQRAYYDRLAHGRPWSHNRGDVGIDREPDRRADAAREAARERSRGELAAILDRLPDRDRAVVAGRWLEGRTYEAIARDLGITALDAYHAEVAGLCRLRKIAGLGPDCAAVARDVTLDDAALDRLDDRARRVLIAHYRDGRPYSEIARELGVSKQRAHRIAARGLARMRKADR